MELNKSFASKGTVVKGSKLVMKNFPLLISGALTTVSHLRWNGMPLVDRLLHCVV